MSRSEGSDSTDKLEEDMPKELRQRILNAMDQIDIGFKKAMLMYSIAFYFGIFVVVFSMVATVFLRGPETNGILFFGGAGMIDIIAFLIFKPTKDLQKSRAGLAQLVAAFIDWYISTHHWDAAIGKEIRAQAIAKVNGIDRVIAAPTNIENVERISRMRLTDTVTILSTMRNIFIEGNGETAKSSQNGEGKSE